MSVRRKFFSRVSAAALLAGPAVSVVAAPAFGQAPPTPTIIADGTVGSTFAAFDTDSLVSIDSSSGVGVEAGSNAFFSWSLFNVSSGQTVTFTSSNPITNFISRVTGSSPSAINGALGTDVSGADVWLINPNGVIFGPGSSVFGDGGLFIGTSDQVGFANGDYYSVQDVGGSTLSTAAPASFGFVNGNVGDITFQGASIDLSSHDAVGFAAHSLAIVDDSGLGLSSNISGFGAGPVMFAAVGDVNGTVSAPTSIATSGAIPGLTGDLVFANSQLTFANDLGGSLFVNAGPAVVDNAFFTAGGAFQAFFTVGDLTLSNSANMSFVVDDDGFQTSTAPGFLQLAIDGDLSLDGSLISTQTLGASAGGALSIAAAGDVTLDNGSFVFSRSGIGSSSVSTPSDPFGDGGDLSIAAGGVLNVIGDSQIVSEAFAAGAGGDLSVNASSVTVGATTSVTTPSSIQAFTEGDGDSGDVSVTADGVLIADGGFVGSYTNGAAGSGGDVLIALNGAGSLTIDGVGSEVFTEASETATGPAGDVRIENGSLVTVSEGAGISSGSDQGGSGGDITIANVDTITVSSSTSDSSSIGMSVSDGLGGVLRLTNVGLLVVDQGGEFGQEVVGSGALGGLDINVANLTVQNGGRFGVIVNGPGSIAETTINVGGLLNVTGVDANGAAAWFGPEANAGSFGAFTVSAADLIVSDSALVQAAVTGAGQGGLFRVASNSFIATNGGSFGVNARDNASLSGLLFNVLGLADVNGANMFVRAEDDSQIGNVGFTFGDLIMSGSGGASGARVSAFDAASIGDVSIAAGSILLDAQSIFDGASLLFEQQGASSLGDVSITSLGGAIALQNGARIELNRFGSGAVGDLLIASDALSLNSPPIASVPGVLTAIRVQNGPSLDLQIANALTILGSGQIFTSTNGPNAGGAINIDAGSIFLDSIDDLAFAEIFTLSSGTGAGGDIAINVGGDLRLANQGFIFTRTTNAGAGGDVSVAASTIDIQGLGFDPNLGGGFGSQIFTQVSSGASGDGGDLSIDADTLTLGQGGSIETATASSGDGGDVVIMVSGDISADGDGDIFSFASDLGLIGGGASTGPIGRGGNISVSATRYFGTQASDIGTFAEADAVGGNLIISIVEDLVLDGRNSDVFTWAAFGGTGGALQVNAGRVELSNQATIGSYAFDTATGGDVALNVSGDVILDSFARILTSGFNSIYQADPNDPNQGLAATGRSGNLSIEAGNLFVSQGASVTTGLSGALDVNNLLQAPTSGDSGDLLIDVAGVVGVEDDGFIGIDKANGVAGGFSLTAGALEVRNSGGVGAQLFGTATAPTGFNLDVGDLTATGDVGLGASLDDDAVIGDVIIAVAGALVASDGAQIGVNAGGASRAGDFVVSANSATLSTGAGLGGDAAGSAVIGDTTFNLGALSMASGSRLGRSAFEGATIGDVTVNVDGAATITTDAAAGSVLTDAGRRGAFTFNAGSLSLLNGGGLLAPNRSSAASGAFTVNIDGALLIDGEGSRLAQFAGGAGSTGLMTVNAGSITLRNGGELESSSDNLSSGPTFPPLGDAGALVIVVDGALIVDGGLILSKAVSTGEGADVTITAQRVDVLNEGEIIAETQGEGAGGDLTINAETLNVLDGGVVGAGSSNPNLGDFKSLGGALTINAANVSLNNGGSIEAFSAPGASGAGGPLTLNVSGLLDINNGSTVAVSGAGSGALGALTVSGGAIRVGPESFLGSRIAGSGRGGLVDLSGASLIVSGEGARVGQLASASSTGDLGQVFIAVDEIVVSDGGAILSEALGSGDGSEIVIKALSVLVDGGSIDTTLGPLAGSAGIATAAIGANPFGDVTIIANTLDVVNGGSVNTATLGGGSAGDILLIVNGVTLGADGQILSQAEAGSNESSGSIAIIASSLVFDGGSILTAADGSGSSGGLTLVVNTPFDFDADFAAVDGDGAAGSVTIGGAVDVDQAILDACGAGACAAFDPFRSAGRPQGVGVSPQVIETGVADTVSQAAAPTTAETAINTAIDTIEAQDEDSEADGEAEGDEGETSYVGVDLTVAADRRESHDGYCEAAARGDANSLVEGRETREVYDPTAVRPALHVADAPAAGTCPAPNE